MRGLLRILRSICRYALLAVGLAVVFAAGVSAVEPATRWKLFVDTPGVYALDFEVLVELSGTTDIDPRRIRLNHQGESVPWWIDGGDTDRLGPGDRLLFLATHLQLWPRNLRSEARLAVIVLDLDHEGGEATPIRRIPRPSTDDTTRPSAITNAVRLFHYEQDLLRAPLTHGAKGSGVDTLWFWGMATERGSAVHRVHLDGLDDLPQGAEPVEIRAHLLGWSNPEVPAGVPQHQVDLLLNGKPIGTLQWDGRAPHEVRLETSAAHFLPSGNQLTLVVPRRVPDGEQDPVIDLVYVDRVEVRYPVESAAAHAEAPLLVGPSEASTWLPDPQAGAGEYLLAAKGWTATAVDGGWIVPPSAATEAWRVHGALPSPLAVFPMAVEDPLPSADTNYLMITPPDLRTGTERLAAIHRWRGLAVTVVDAHDVYDHYGFGARSAEAIRSFLVAAERSASLRWVLLVGDANWLADRSPVPYPEAEPAEQNLLPTWTELTEFGPAAGDHPYVASAHDEAQPRLAIGRLPVTDPESLERAVDKIADYLAAESASTPPTVLLVSDQSSVSVSRSRRVARTLEGGALLVTEVEASADRALDEQLIEALDRGPEVVHFSGHGSRHSWQLGATYTLGKAAFFDREDVTLLEPRSRPPLVLSISCATAPFDHPSADSLAETMLHAEGRGAAAFVGASARLYTPPRFGASMLQALADGETLGEAMATAKGTLGSRRIALLYNLLGDPALPLR